MRNWLLGTRTRRRLWRGQPLPAIYVDLYEAASRGDHKTVACLQKIVLAISGGVYSVGEPGSSYLRGLKTALSVIGIGNGVMAEPYQPLTPDERENLPGNLGSASTAAVAAATKSAWPTL